MSDNITWDEAYKNYVEARNKSRAEKELKRLEEEHNKKLFTQFKKFILKRFTKVQ